MDIGEIFLLIITILGDGVLLFLFQQTYSSKIKTVEKNNNYKEEVLRQHRMKSKNKFALLHHR